MEPNPGVRGQKREEPAVNAAHPLCGGKPPQDSVGEPGASRITWNMGCVIQPWEGAGCTAVASVSGVQRVGSAACSLAQKSGKPTAVRGS